METVGGGHIPVLMASVIALLRPRKGETYVDATAGLGGHAAAIAPRLAPGGRVILNDMDEGNLTRAMATVRATLGRHRDDAGGTGEAGAAGEGKGSRGGGRQGNDPEGDTPRETAGGVELIGVRGNFAELPRWMERRGLAADAILADLGFASVQMDDPARGFSFRRDGPLDMRLDPAGGLTAAELVATLPERDLERLFREYGEERESRRVAGKLVRERERAPILTTGRLAQIVHEALGREKTGGIDAATRVFQALRIAVNDEVGSLDALLAEIRRGVRRAASEQPTPAPAGWLRPGARVGIISFHSLEDRAVKRAMGESVSAGWAEDLSDGIVKPDPSETEVNPRARSAKLRLIRVRGPAAGGVTEPQQARGR